MELTLILIFTFLVIAFIALLSNSSYIDSIGDILEEASESSIFTTIKEILLFPILYLIPMLFFVIVLLIVIAYMIVNNIKYEKTRIPQDMKYDTHTVSLTESKTLNERFTDIERDFNIKHYNKICSKTPVNQRKEHCMLFAKHDCNSIGC